MLTEKNKKRFLEIKKIKKAYNIEIFAHYYQRNEIKNIADFVGGTIGLVRKARESLATTIVLCGVQFIAESIQEIKPKLNLIIPRKDTECPFTDWVTVEIINQAKKEYPKALIVAETKALKVIKEIADLKICPKTAQEKLSQVKDKQLIVLPGTHWVDFYGYGNQIVKRWPQGVCLVHQQTLKDDLLKTRAKYPQALIVANILCLPEIKNLAQHLGDTDSIWNFCQNSLAKEFIIISEAGLIESLSLHFPLKKFHETEVEIFCPNMKLTNLKAILEALNDFISNMVT